MASDTAPTIQARTEATASPLPSPPPTTTLLDVFAPETSAPKIHRTHQQKKQEKEAKQAALRKLKRAQTKERKRKRKELVAKNGVTLSENPDSQPPAKKRRLDVAAQHVFGSVVMDGKWESEMTQKVLFLPWLHC